MAKISGKINQHEKAICARLKHFREGIKWSQPQFAAQVALTRDQLASIEYARTPLRYDVAWRIRQAFGLSLLWLDSGHLDPDGLYEDSGLPLPNAPKTSDDSLLSEVVESSRQGYSKSKPKRKAIKLNADDLADRGSMLFSLKFRLRQWIAQLPEWSATEFHNALKESAERFIKQLPEESRQLCEARFDALIFEEMRRDIGRRSRGLKEFQSTEDKTLLTDSASADTDFPVQGKWPALKRQLQNATEKTGKSALAKFLKVDLTRVSQWLTDAKSQREPGAEYALQMQDWLRRQT